ncbi:MULTISPECIES: flavodoxin family protein [unclassified Desulfovibrio]|uniref:flavodoxin family protein n=1 Tax=unclassified Desulfovibrio TaxID=2593640 RepID=UPI001F15124F|nr:MULTISPECIES: flavodoxin family protein [unclassified Desulfovibrio]
MCSPHADGVSDLLAETFAAGLEEGGCPASRVPLRAHPVEPCTGCAACAQPPHACALAGRDEAEWLFARFAEAPLVLLASPIYFYALPAPFKAWIDRGQRFWAARAAGIRAADSPTPPHAGEKPVLAALAAARPRGEELFSGALRTLAWFAGALGAHLAENRVFRGLDRREDICGRPQDLSGLREWGRSWGRCLADAEKKQHHVPPQ